MILSVSIGNTNTRCAVGTKEHNQRIDLSTKSICRTEDFIESLEKQFNSDIWEIVRGSIVASVVTDKTPIITDAILRKTNKLPQRIDMSKLNVDVSGYKSNLGEDRAVCCAAALSEYTPPIIVVDLGTATTVNCINANGVFIGGAIFIGVQTGLSALCEHTSLLQRVSDYTDVATIGNDTQSGLISGAIIGTANMIEGYINRIGTDLGGSPTVIVTGGNAPMILPHCNFDFIHKPTLLIDELFSQYKGSEHSSV